MQNALQSVERRCPQLVISKPLKLATKRWGTGLGKADGVHRVYSTAPVSAGATALLVVITTVACKCSASLSTRQAPPGVGKPLTT